MNGKFLLMLMLLLFVSCAVITPEKKHEIIRIKGSDTMVRLAQRWAEEFMKVQPDVSIYVESVGSASGIRAMINGAADIATASRPMQPDEVKELAEKKNSLGISVLTAKDALSIYLHPANPIHNLSIEQIKAIFTGKITNWKNIGGADHPIQVFTRESNSGTFLFFEEHILLGEHYSPQCIPILTTSQLIQRVASDTFGIGYGGLAYGDNVIHASINGVQPTIENVANGSYPISRYLHLYTAETPKGKIKEFIDWVVSPQGQKIVRETGYIPLLNIQ